SPATSKTEADADTRAFVRGLYHSVLGRDADEGQPLQDWVNVLNTVKADPGADPLHLGRAAGIDPYMYVTQGIWQSAEHRRREVESYYHNFLGRDLDLNNAQDVADREYWVNQFLLVGAEEADVIRGFLTSAEYLFQHRADASLADSLNASLLAGAAPA